MKWFIVVIIAVMLVLVGCGSSLDTQDDSCLALEEGPVRQNCYFEQLQCSKMTSGSVRDSCVAELAKQKKDITVCNLIKDETVVCYCQNQIAQLTNDQQVCNGITNTYWE